MAEDSERPAAKPSSRKKGCGCFAKTLALIFLVVVLLVLFAPITGGIKKARELECTYNAKFIAKSMDDYANYHGTYPTGNSSTEIFKSYSMRATKMIPITFAGTAG